MGQVTEPSLQGKAASRRVLCDYLSVSTRFERDAEVKNLLDSVQSLVRDITGYGEFSPMKKTGNFDQGVQFNRIRGQVKWTTWTAASINDWDEQGRCVGTMNVMFSGSQGIGRLPIEQAFSLIQGLADLGFRSCRRLDLTIDVFDDWDLDLFFIADRLKEEAWRIPRRDAGSFGWFGAVKPRDRGPTAATLYLGPDSSTSRVVIYDKGAQKESERAWIRFERVSKAEDAQRLFDELLGVVDSAWEHGMALEVMDNFVTAAVKAAADIRDVTGFPDYPTLPKNWMRSPKATTPDMLSSAYLQVAPLEIGELRLAGGFAAQARHAIRSTGKTVWKMAILAVAHGQEPGSVALQMGFPHHSRVTDEDFMEMAQNCGKSMEELEQAEKAAINAFIALVGADVHCVDSDRTLLRKEAEKAVTWTA